MNTAKHKVEEAFEILSAALHTGRSHHSRFLNRAHALLESALCDMEMAEVTEHQVSQEDVARIADEWVYIGEFPPLPKAN